jgi:DNA-binding NtrC family response regulator
VSEEEQAVLRAVRALTEVNPFLPERTQAEQAALGSAFIAGTAVWHLDARLDGIDPNIPLVDQRVEALARTLRERLARGARGSPDELDAYQGLIFYLLFQRYAEDLFQLVVDEERGQAGSRRVRAYDRYRKDFVHFLRIPGVAFPTESDPVHMWALGYQARRAFHHTFRQIYGGSMPAAKLRADVWQSIFTRSASRYRRVLYDQMADIPTLIMGESGTGKELVARAIGFSRYIPFNEKTKSFTESCTPLFHALNLSALPSSLIESELFGHRRGAFTGAIEDHTGWLEVCKPLGAIFLDEIGDFDGQIQVKLLRVLQTRTFQPVGDTSDRRFEGKIVAATNRDLAKEMEEGRFRPDLYYRICADVIQTPTLAEQIADAPDDLRDLVLILARRIVGLDEADALAVEVVDWIDRNLGRDYGWPGNVRELEQCVRNVMIRGAYRPPDQVRPLSEDVTRSILAGRLTAEEVLRHYCTRVYHQAGSYEEAARRLGLDRRTVKARVDAGLLEQLRSSD